MKRKREKRRENEQERGERQSWRAWNRVQFREKVDSKRQRDEVTEF